jgi:predicted RNase H-like HicB family nuclease
MKYLIVVEISETGYSAYSPDLPGRVSTGGTQEETIAIMKEVIEFHIDGLKSEGMPVPMPVSRSACIEIAA